MRHHTHTGIHRKKLHQRVRKPPVGSSPGTLAKSVDTASVKIRLVSYDENNLVEETLEDVHQLQARLGQRRVDWIDIQGLADHDVLRNIADSFNLHALALEDIVHVHQRPKLESYADHLFIVTRMPNMEGEVLTEQLSMVLGENYLITFQERPGDCFDAVRQRIRNSKGRIRQSGPDYLAYALIDAVLDAYFPLLEQYSDSVENLEFEVANMAEQVPVPRLHKLKRELLELRRAIWPQREMISAMQRDETGMVTEGTRTYLRDCHDHALQLLDIVETYREIASSMMDLYLSSINLRMNEAIKVLTIIATVFIPLGFIASIYGMNFDPDVSPFNMPELDWYFGYPFALSLMLIVALSFLIYFWRQGWMGGGKKRDSA